MDLRKGTSHRRFARKLACVSMLAVVTSFSRGSLVAQVVINGVAEEADAQSAPKGFAVLKADSKIVEMLEDFNRYAGKKSWELAFRSLNSIDEANNPGMVSAEDGFLVPTRARVKQGLLRLPPEGRDAYRLFNDASAKQLWEHVQNPTGGIPADEIETLRKLVDRYSLTSVADLAADRLGDALFEQGKFAAAEETWRSSVETYPDTHLSPAKLQVKRCVALARLGHRDPLSALVALVREQYADQKVTIGGQEVSAAEFVQSLVPRDSPSQPTPARDSDAFILPSADEPIWQIRIAVPNTSGQIDPQTGEPMNALHFTPCGAVDDKRFYANWLGTVYAADLETGKMLWRTGKFTETPQQITNLIQRGMSIDSFFLTAAGGKLLVMRQPSGNLLGQVLGGQMAQGGQLTMECLDAASGKSLWSGGPGVTIVAAPYLLDGVAYVIGMATNNSTMNLVAIDLASGREQWRVQLGTPQNTNNNPYGRGGWNFGGPKMLAGGGRLYVATNNGAFLAVGLASHQVEWALQHETKPFLGNQRFFWNGMMVGPSESPGTLLDDEGTFYLKDGAARLLYALDPSTPSVKWKRPVTAEESVAAIDGPIAYLLGQELSALDLKSRKLLWSTKIPGETADHQPLICPGHVYVATARGIFDINPSNGDIRRVFRGADRESGGGRLLLAGDKLISISGTAVTAYPIQRAKPPAVTSKSSQ